MVRFTPRLIVTAVWFAFLPSPAASADGFLDDVTFTMREPIEIDARVLDVSPRGHVVAVDDAKVDRVLVFDVGGTLEHAWHVPDGPRALTQVNWDPSGYMMAFDQRANWADPELGSLVRTLDVRDGAITSGSPSEPGRSGVIEFNAAWLGVDSLMFLRVPARPNFSVQPAELVTTSGSSPPVVVPLDVTPRDLVPQEGATLGGSYVVTIGTSTGSTVVSIDSDGVATTLVESSFPEAPVRSASADDHRVLVIQYDPAGLELGPLIMFETDRVPIVSRDVRALNADFAPEGQLVAAVEVRNPGPGATNTLTMWDPESGDSEQVLEFDIPALGLVWTHDDQIVVWGPDAIQVVDVVRS